MFKPTPTCLSALFGSWGSVTLPAPGRQLRTVGLGLGACLLGLLAACGPVEFDLSQNLAAQHFTGSATGALTTILPTPAPFGLNIAQEDTARNGGPISTVSLNSMEFHVTDATSVSANSFDFVQTLTVYIESTRPNSSLAKDPVATLTGAPGKVVSIDLSTFPAENLLPYINEGAQFTSVATGTLPQQDLTFAGSITVHVKTL